jgi:hypothetical protein
MWCAFNMEIKPANEVPYQVTLRAIFARIELDD